MVMDGHLVLMLFSKQYQQQLEHTLVLVHHHPIHLLYNYYISYHLVFLQSSLILLISYNILIINHIIFYLDEEYQISTSLFLQITLSTTIQFSFTIIIYTLYSFIYTYFLFKSHILLQSTLRGNSRNSWDKTHLTGHSFISDFS